LSEVKIDNPAQRLLEILEKGQGYSTTRNCREVWIAILQIRENEEHHLLSRLASVMALPGRIIQVREDNFATIRGRSNHWKTRVEQAFFRQNLDSVWETFWSNIDKQTLSEIGLLSDVFETRGAHAGMNEGEVENLLARIAELRSEIRNSELSSSVKTLLLRQLAKIRDALESYSISGVEPVMDAVQSTLGLAVLHPDYRQEISKNAASQFGEKISDLLSDVANVVTIAGALPALTVAVNTALNLLSK